MRLAMVLTLAAIAAGSATGELRTSREVTVYYNGPPALPGFVRLRAQHQAAEMFASIGVDLRWRTGTPPKSETGAIVIEVVTGTPITSYPGALAYALPYEGVHIRILWDRIAPDRVANDSTIYMVLAHVIVHEITHILQGVDTHSEEGVMKAQWSVVDRIRMKSTPLGFTADDVDLIYLGMDVRSARATR